MIALVSSLLTGCTRKYESADYTVISKEGPFEIREYPAITLVSTPMQQRGEDGSFMKLFRFIEGRNDRSEKISMTTPVLMTGTTSGTMSFVLPKTVVREGPPNPSNPDLTVSTVPPTTYATYRFHGSLDASVSEAAAAKLLEWVKARNLVAAGTPIFAYYNPPWTPGFLRHNEVLVPLPPATQAK
jgi:effector-binding domain-containing protein